MSADLAVAPPPEDESENDGSLFREEVVAARQTRILGDVVFARPLSFRLMAAFALTVIAAVVATAYFGTYARRSTVVGEVVPDTGVIRMFAPMPGYVLKNAAVEGRHVRKGDTLLVISLDRTTADGPAQAVISSDIQKSMGLLKDQMAGIARLSDLDRDSLAQRVAISRQQVADIDRMIVIQKSRVGVAQDIASRYEKLLASQYVSEADVQTRQADLLDQQSRLASLEQSRTVALRDLGTAQSDLDDLPIKMQSSLGDVQRLYHNADSDFHESEGRRQLVIVAPVSGIATTIMARAGQMVDPSKPLLSILPDGATLHAELYATSKAIGFVKIGDPVKIRFDAYPYEQFGLGTGRVVEVARSSMTPMQLNELGEMVVDKASPGDRGAPLYRIVVALDAQAVMAYGKPQRLEPNMTLEADIIQDTRRLYEWLLDPLYALDGRS